MLQKELAKRLRARYDTKMDGNGWLEVSSDGIPLCRIKYNGQFLSNADQNLSDEYRSKIADIQDEISTVREYVGLYEHAPQMKATDVSDYRQLATFGDTVLAATYSEKNGFMFCTWKQNADGDSVFWGDYSPNYEYVKEAFAVRSGLVSKHRLFSENESADLTLTSSAGGFGGRTGLYDVALPIKVDTKSGFQLAHPGDSIDLAYPTMNTRRGRVGEKIAHTVTPGNTQGYFFIDLNAGAKLTETARCITTRQDSGISKHKGEHSAVFIEDEPRAVVTPDKKTIRQQGRWIKEPNEPMFTLTVQDRHGILRYGRVRKLTPRECWRLQGFADEQFDKAAATGLKDGRLYKMAGNAVSVPVVSAVGAVIKRIYQEQIQKG